MQHCTIIQPSEFTVYLYHGPQSIVYALVYLTTPYQVNKFYYTLFSNMLNLFLLSGSLPQETRGTLHHHQRVT
jgi:hypothetical protein